LVDGLLGSWIGPQWTGLILATPALLPIMVIMLLPRLVVALGGTEVLKFSPLQSH